MDLALTPREVVRQLVRGSGLSVLIKAANAVLAYAMLVVIARVSSGEVYGVFAVAFSVGISVAFIAVLGQPRAATRYWTQWTAQGRPDKARAVLRRTLVLTALGMGLAALLMLTGGALSLFTAMPWSLGVAAGTALFAVAFGWAEFASAALRAQGYIAIAMAPRDIAWRVLVCAVFGWSALAGWRFGAEALILVVGATLMIVVAPQIALLRRAAAADAASLSGEDRKTITRYSAIMWAAATADLAKNYAGVVIVSGYLGAHAAGIYFAAERTANLLSFLLLAITLVAGPQVSHYYHSGRTDLVRLVVGLAGCAAGLAALAGIVFFFFFGARVLALFNPDYAAHLPILLVLALGQLFAAASGPVHILLVMTGHERMGLILVVCVGLGSVTLQALGAHFWGLLGVAGAAAGGTVFISVFAVVYAWRRLGIDSTGLTLLAGAWRRRSSGAAGDGEGR